MAIVPARSKNQFCVVFIPSSAGHEWLLRPLAALALRGPFKVVDAGGDVDPHALARAVHAQAGHAVPILSRNFIGRSFTCHQLVAILKKASWQPCPLIVLGFLAAFQDESVPLYERERIFTACVNLLRRVARSSPVLVTVKSSHKEFAESLSKSAHRTFQIEWPSPPATLPLF